MKGLDILAVYPVDWPKGRPRTAARKSSLFRQDGRALTMTVAKSRLRDQLSAMTRTGQPWRTTNIMLTCNIRYTLSGARDMKLSRRDPAAHMRIFFKDLAHLFRLVSP